MDVGRFFGTFLIVGIVGPAFWLGVNVLENWLIKKGFRIAGLDIFSLKSWRSVLKRRSNSRSSEAASQQSLLK